MFTDLKENQWDSEMQGRAATVGGILNTSLIQHICQKTVVRQKTVAK